MLFTPGKRGGIRTGAPADRREETAPWMAPSGGVGGGGGANRMFATEPRIPPSP
jgi:hypothetical protein